MNTLSYKHCILPIAISFFQTNAKLYHNVILNVVRVKCNIILLYAHCVSITGCK